MIFLYILPGAFLVPIIHEWVKAVCSSRLGDPTPKSKGFLCGNPLKYFEPIGFFFMFMFGYGWGQPVPTSPLYYKDRRIGTLITYITPSLVNLLLGLGVMAGIDFTQGSMIINPILIHLFYVLIAFARLNIGMAIFNLIPVYPMDGARVLQLFVKPEIVGAMNRYEKIFQVVLLVVLYSGILHRFIYDPIGTLFIQSIFSY